MNISSVPNSDLELLREVAITTFRESFGDQNTKQDLETYERTSLSKEQLKREMDNPSSYFFFAKEKSKVIGYLKLNESGAQTEGDIQDSIEVERIYLLSAYQGQEFGQLMLTKAIEFAKNMNCETLWLGVWDQNKRAIKFYKRNGFKIFGSHDFLLGSDLQTDLLMKLELSPLSKD